MTRKDIIRGINRIFIELKNKIEMIEIMGRTNKSVDKGKIIKVKISTIECFE